MKFEMKIVIMSFVVSLFFMAVFTYVSMIGVKTMYVYQVGIYKEEKNKNQKLKELKTDGYQGYFYEKNQQFYVLSMISEDYQQIQSHSTKVKGIIKKYVVANDTTVSLLLENLAKGE